MDTQNRIHMAHRIAEFFATMPDRAEAVAGLATCLHPLVCGAAQRLPGPAER